MSWLDLSKHTKMYDPNKNAHLKGRRRFNADLEDVKELARDGYQVQGLIVKGEP